MDDRTILFVTCVSREELYARCVSHIESLKVPEGYKIELFPIRGTKSIFEGYNKAVTHPAKYKVYLHQDCFIFYPDFISSFVSLFERNKEYAMLGFYGQNSLYHFIKDDAVGQLLCVGPHGGCHHIQCREEPGEITPIKVLDGYILITQYDLTWRSDILDGFHFYDYSQALEFYKLGYKVGVINQAGMSPWTMHYIDHVMCVIEYERCRKIFESHYLDFIKREMGVE
ncbi:hypothetical protein J2Z48_001028 [Croceifilum oryzae]|uniref:Streptomycin biosynthesis protein StrF domain-containing protein n=1 Tax=Croceifilum oryzae TaxID=1553429 RepID=A0AAJ1TIQ5_9BACL|nr:glycosyltransferase family protein [Croceifilum oryzae]MDQ0416856.1 hypothetical protein [Croceifilum oryzae]